MKISLKSAIVLAPGILLLGCGQAKKPVSAPVTSATSPAPEAAASPAVTENSAAPATQSGDASRGRPRGGGGGGDRGADRLQRMATSLSLTPEQTDKLKAVMDAQRPAMDAIRNDTSLSREDQRAKMMELRKEIEPQIAAILTPEQQKKWEEERANMQARMGGRGGGGGGGRGAGAGGAPPPSPAAGN